MILALNLNCSLDKIYTVEKLELGGVTRAKTTQNTAGGKGLHVANVCKALNEPYLVTGFLGGHTGDLIQDILTERKVNQKFLPIRGETRSCINIGTPDGKQTEVLEAGPEISAAEREAFLQAFKEFLQQASLVVGSGSLPKGLEKSFYGALITITHDAGKKFLLDTSGDALAESLSSKPFFIKPNRDEIEALTGNKIHSEEDAAREIRHFLQEGIRLPVISLGKDGSVFGYEDRIYRVLPPAYKAVNAVGSGDAFVAGIAIGLHRKLPVTECVRLGSACGTANVLEAESGWVDPQKVDSIKKQVQIIPLS